MLASIGRNSAERHMTSTSTATFVPRTAESWRDPFGMYAALREHDPVHHVADGDYYVLSRFEDIRAAVTDAETFSSAQGLTFGGTQGEAEIRATFAPLVMTDPPAHTAFRRLVSRGFTPRHVTELDEPVRAFVRERLDHIRDLGGEADIVAELFKPLPSMVVAYYLGVPTQDRPRFDGWTDSIVGANAAGRPEQAADATVGMIEYFTELIEIRRAHPEDDTVSHLVAAAQAGDSVTPLQILGFAFTMVTGGNDTSTGLLGGSSELLTAHPAAKRRLAGDPGLIPGAVEEFLRLTTPVQCLARTTTRAVTVGDAAIPSGKKVLMLYGSGNRDEREFGANAAELDIERRPSQLLTFSNGAHFCLGAAAARLMGRVVLEELLAAFPNYTVDAATGVFASGHYIRRYDSLPFRAKG
jgi:cytochrome P450